MHPAYSVLPQLAPDGWTVTVASVTNPEDGPGSTEGTISSGTVAVPFSLTAGTQQYGNSSWTDEIREAFREATVDRLPVNLTYD